MQNIKRRFTQLILIIKYILCLIISPLVYKKYNDVWLIGERGDEAKDNGFVFYKYLKQHHRDIKVKYVITKNSADIKKIDKNDITEYRSFDHLLSFINAKYLISTHVMGISPEQGLFSKLDRKKLVYTRGKRIFLQHGVIYNYLPQLNKVNLDMFVTSSLKEKNFIIKANKIDEQKVKCTGLARYDNLIKKPQNFILVAPTWRTYLFYSTEASFKNSLYYKKWNSFFQNKELIKILEENDIKLYFYPHYEIQKFCDCFDIDNKNIVVASKENFDISKLLRECKAYVTDYSSTLFDIAYLKTPAIYYQFDYKEFYSNHYKEGYLKLSLEGFGCSVDNEQDLIKQLKKICKNNFQIENKYSKRIDQFFMYNDCNQCHRIYEEICNLK